MKRTSITVFMIVCLAGLFFSQDTFSKVPWKNPTDKPSFALHTMRAPFAYPSLSMPFFSFYPIIHNVCEKPVFPFDHAYRYTGLSLQRQYMGSNFVEMKSGLTFRKGNSYFLVPRTFVLPTNPDVNLSRPTMMFSNSK